MTGFNGMAGQGRSYPFPRLDDEILALWSAGRDTLDIARILGISESEIANHLPRILEHRRQNVEWNFDALVSAGASK